VISSASVSVLMADIKLSVCCLRSSCSKYIFYLCNGSKSFVSGESNRNHVQIHCDAVMVIILRFENMK
jgi:hypothetical protein